MIYSAYFSLACLLVVGGAAVSPDQVTYKFFSREHFDGVAVHFDDVNLNNFRNVFDPKLPTVVLIHGWKDNYEADSNTFVRASILSKLNANIIKVDWSPLSHLGYFEARNAVPHVGRFAADFLRRVSTLFGYPLSDVTLVGFSLGAHIAGNIGKNLPGQIGVIVALDPAGPFIKSTDVNISVHKSDAQYVQGIHTNGGTLGMSDAIGHSDFYPNKGSRQPGCGIDLLGGCAHNRAWELFAESVTNNKFVSLGCSTLKELSSGRCSGERKLMGGLKTIDKNATGLFFLKTNKSSPYGCG